MNELLSRVGNDQVSTYIYLHVGINALRKPDRYNQTSLTCENDILSIPSSSSPDKDTTASTRLYVWLCIVFVIVVYVVFPTSFHNHNPLLSLILKLSAECISLNT